MPQLISVEMALSGYRGEIMRTKKDGPKNWGIQRPCLLESFCPFIRVANLKRVSFTLQAHQSLTIPTK